MKYDIKNLIPGKHFFIEGVSYIGKPRSNTAMFISKKVSGLLSRLNDVKECLVYAEEGMDIPKELTDKHAFVLSLNPQMAYARFATHFDSERTEREKMLGFIQANGSVISADSIISNDAYVEPGCIIGPDVQIGSNSIIKAGCILRHCTIGENFLCNEQAVIGAKGFTITKDEKGNNYRIPTLGRVVIGDNVEIGVHDNISCGSGGDTLIDDWVKCDAMVHIGHDVHLCKNVEITAGTILGGFLEVGEGTRIGMGSVIRNRLSIGENAFIGMGSVVIRSVKQDTFVLGNPATKVFSPQS